MSLAMVWMSGRAPTGMQYRNPENGTIYTYTGFGRCPAWLTGPDGKPNPEYEVATNAAA
jgi:hypothetical protein